MDRPVTVNLPVENSVTLKVNGSCIDGKYDLYFTCPWCETEIYGGILTSESKGELSVTCHCGKATGPVPNDRLDVDELIRMARHG